MKNERRARLDEQRLQFHVGRGPNEGVYRFDQLMQDNNLAIKVSLVEIVNSDFVKPCEVVVGLPRQRIADLASSWSRSESLQQSGGFLNDLSMLVNHPAREALHASQPGSAQGYLPCRDFRLIRHKDDTDDLCIGQPVILTKCANG
jgi:hypothetical protein